ncbi:hypothetical protein ANN_19297 [Periplaneta americana]|uniref:HAT C-terminal dimerisation domain-containing protein n=1 Tax=Periplaneta americana TaxID=6978 RepID=A0ABQ8S9H3_PERAM|nr:hypothetical protein ANN_19297 [Periplaneta americana]
MNPKESDVQKKEIEYDMAISGIRESTKDSGSEVTSGQFPEKELEATVQNYNMLEKNRLKTELSVLYERSDYRRIDGAVPLLKHIMKNNLQETFSEVTKLLKIMITTPMTTSEPERCFSSLKRIKTFLRNTMSQDRLTALALLSVEKKLVADMEGFNSKVIDSFCNNKERRMDFTLRH